MFNNPYYNAPLYNPNLTPQQRVAQMEQQYNMNFPQQPVQSVQQPVQQQGFKLVTIGSIEEAKAAPVDTINDTPSFFLNRGKNEIYLKQYNSQNGLPIFHTFQLAQEPASEVKEEKGTNTYEKNFKVLNDKIDGLYSLLSTNQVSEQVEEKNEQVSEQVRKGGKNAK